MNQTHSTPGHMSLDPPWVDFQAMLDQAARAGHIFPGLQVQTFESTPSTNDICSHAAQKGSTGPLVVLANHQSAGRGRQGSQWQSPAGCNLLFSLLLEVKDCGHDLLALAASLSVVEAIERTAGSLPVECRVKWPNDILLADRKVAGILIEKPAAKGAELAVIGIGINVNQPWFPPELAQHATSLAIACGCEISRLTLAVELLCALQRWLLPSPARDVVAAHWKARCDMLGQKVSLECAGAFIRGVVEDIDPFNGLVLREDTGSLRMCHAATSRMVRPSDLRPSLR
jgi:BirA family biotin operon repressor/biotin-[acetyl-CoA-carboxylase] ligase